MLCYEFTHIMRYNKCILKIRTVGFVTEYFWIFKLLMLLFAVIYDVADLGINAIYKYLLSWCPRKVTRAV